MIEQILHDTKSFKVCFSALLLVQLCSCHHLSREDAQTEQVVRSEIISIPPNSEVALTVSCPELYLLKAGHVEADDEFMITESQAHTPREWIATFKNATGKVAAGAVQLKIECSQ